MFLLKGEVKQGEYHLKSRYRIAIKIYIDIYTILQNCEKAENIRNTVNLLTNDKINNLYKTFNAESNLNPIF